MQIDIRRDFAAAPGPRYRTEGKHSGEEFRQDLLVKALQDAMKAGGKLIIDLDGTAGYATSFLEESFGGLIREEGYSMQQLESVLEFRSTEEPQLLDEILRYMREAKPKAK